MEKFWDSAFALEPPEDYDTHRYVGDIYVVSVYVLFCSVNSHKCFIAVKSLELDY